MVCSKCKEDKSTDSFNKNPAFSRGYQYQCKICMYEGKKLWNTKNPEIKRARDKRFRDSHREHLRVKEREYERANPAKMAAKVARRKLAKMKRTPPWLTKEHFDQIQIFYDSAARLTKEFGVKMNVDHIVPLQGENISGLHVPWNLQVISASENSSKSNKF